jgi:hypothetical protein
MIFCEELFMSASSTPLALILLAISLVCLYGLFKGFKTGVPPGQKGLKGTAWSNNTTLLIVQMVALFLLFCMSFGAGALMLLHHKIA